VELLDAPDGQALVLLASHALLDGDVAALVLDALLGPDGGVVHPAESTALPVLPRELARLVALTPRLLARGARSARSRARSGAVAAAPFSGAAAPWNSPGVSAARAYADVTVPLVDVLAAARVGGTTLTAVVLTLVGGALREHLAAQGRLPERDLLAVVPVGARVAADPPTRANLTSYVFVPTGTTTAEPGARLAAVATSLRVARERSAAGDARLSEDAQELWVLLRPVHQLSRAVARRTVGRPPASLVVSTVRGPARALALAGSRVTAIGSGSVLADEMGLNVTAWSHGDALTVGVVARPDRVPDVAGLADAIGDGLAVLAPALRPS
jgi:hypothetical protein